jgi:DNA mismatch repair protein MutH
MLGQVYRAIPLAVTRNMSMLYWRPKQATESRLRQAVIITKDVAEVESGNFIAWRPSTPAP